MVSIAIRISLYSPFACTTYPNAYLRHGGFQVLTIAVLGDIMLNYFPWVGCGDLRPSVICWAVLVVLVNNTDRVTQTRFVNSDKLNKLSLLSRPEQPGGIFVH